MNSNIRNGLAAACALAAVCGTAAGQALPTYPLGNSPPTTTAWSPDRFAPARFLNSGSFAGRDNVLTLGVDEADGPGNRPPAQSSSFFDTQGRRILRAVWDNLPYSFVASVYVPSAWSTSTGLADSRRTDMWGVATPTGQTTNDFAQFAIFGFTNEGAPAANSIEAARDLRAPADFMPDGGGSGRYQVWDPEAGGFQVLPQPVRYDQWSDLCITLVNGALEYRLGDTLVYTDSTINVDVSGVPTPVTGFREVIMQAKNFGQRPTPPGGVAGVTYDSRWANLAAGPGTCSTVSIGGQFGADLRITKSVAPSAVPVGQNAVFTLVASNAGPAPATGVVVLDTLPPGLAYVSNNCGASFSAPLLTWNIGNLAVGQNASCALTVQVTTTGTFVNTASVDADQSDPVFANNSAVSALGGGIVLQVPGTGPQGLLLLMLLVGAIGMAGVRRR